jgi:DNA-binding response OmpR family regulator
MEYDCIVLDLTLPKINGIELLKSIRAQGNKSKVLILTARDAVEDRVRGLDAEADDYLVKPFAFDELLARNSRFNKKAGRCKKQHTNLG